MVESTFFQSFPSQGFNQAGNQGGYSNEFLDFSNFNNKSSPNRNLTMNNNNFNNSSPFGMENNFNKMQGNFVNNGFMAPSSNTNNFQKNSQPSKI